MSSSSALSRLVNLQRQFEQTKQSENGFNKGDVKISSEVFDALSNGRAVVALESTIISHGMPYPQNLQTAKEVEAIVRENGAVPATIAILGGVPCIERLASLGTKAQKTARRDIAHIVGIPVFVTGGIGGVHRHSEKNSPEDCARLIDANLKLGLGSGIIIGVPIPKEHAASGRMIESAIQIALKEARDKNVSGNAETPFLLAKVNELTKGASLASNIALVKNNALVGASIAAALSKLR
ncbi:hypothetical protein MKX01_030449 [Papaver californicum]|nr:hypothetical protein MKX01_030449 [Papaver californicum]